MKKIAVLPGDGIGVEIVAEAVKVLECLRREFKLDIEMEQAPVGGAAYEAAGHPLPDATLALAQEADAVLLGAVGGYQWESLDISLRPEKGLLGLRKELGLFANLRPAILYPQLADASTLKPDVVAGLDIMIVRELTGDIYFGQPRGVRVLENGERQGFNTMVYSESEIERIGHTAFKIARKRNKKVCSVDKANVLECTELWREVMIRVARDYPDVSRGQCGDATGARAQAIRCHGHRQYVRRHLVRLRCDVDRLHRHAALCFAGCQRQGHV